MPKPLPPFWSLIRKDERGCWLWVGSLTRLGYGRYPCKIDGRQGKKQAHRLAWELWYGPIPEGMCVCHRCDVPRCVNPEHLFLGTSAANNRDRDAKGRTARGEKTVGNVKLSREQFDAIASLKGSGRRQLDVATQFGVTQQTVSNIWLGKTWKWTVDFVMKVRSG